MTCVEILLASLLVTQSVAWLVVDFRHYSRELDVEEGGTVT